MTQKQLNRYKVISMAIEGKLTNDEAAQALNLSKRQIIRLKKGVKEVGPSFLIHKNTGRKPSHAIDNELKQKIIELKNSEKYKDTNFLHFKDILEDHEGIKISYSALYSILSSAGIKSPRKHRKRKPHHRRKRKPQEGLLIQMDASPFDWLGTGEKLSLHGAIDDATGKVVGLYLCKNECLHGYFEITRQMLLNHGIPASIYTDKHSIFLSTNASKLSIEDQLQGKVVKETQFGRAMNELGISLTYANSPQAKGRIERLWNTLQGRLPIEFKLANIKNIDDANEFLASYISIFNEKFAVEPEEPESAFRPVPNNIAIENILCVKETRKLDNGYVFSFYNKHYQVLLDDCSIPVKSKVTVLVSPSFGVKVQYKDKIYDVISFVKPKRNKKDKDSTLTKNKSKKVYRPPKDHYFKQGHDKFKKITFEESDRDILNMLEEIFFKKRA